MGDKTVEDICEDIDKSVLDSFADFKIISPYAAKVMKRMRIDISRFNGYDLSGDINEDWEGSMCDFVAQNFYKVYEEMKESLYQKMIDNLRNDKFQEASVIAKVSSALRHRSYFLRLVYDVRDKSTDLDPIIN